MGDVTSLVNGLHRGDSASLARLHDVVYATLRDLARRHLSRESHETLPPTALVNEAYLRLTNGTPIRGWENRRHFYGAAAQAMRDPKNEIPPGVYFARLEGRGSPEVIKLVRRR
jgi:hypothetical protein